MAETERPAEPAGSDLQQLFTWNPHLKVIFCGDDEVIVKHGSRSRFTKNIRDEGHTKLLGRLLRNVVPPVSLAGLQENKVLAASELADAAKLVDYLRGEGVLVDPQSDPTHVYLETILNGDPALSARTVGVVGSGYLGSRIACQLVSLGIGKLVVLDDRRVEHAALDRRYFELLPGAVKDGRPYVECLREHLAKASFTGLDAHPAALDDEAAVRKVAEQCDFMVVALEAFSARTLHLANSVAIEVGRPWISVYVDGSEMVVGPLYVPGQSCCYNEFEIQHEASLGGMKNEYFVYKEALNQGKINGSHFVLPPYLGVASGLAVTAVLHFLTSGRSFLVGRANRLDFERLSIDYEEVLRLPRCPACSPSRPGYRHLYM